MILNLEAGPEAVISEKFSEKRKRGRPRTFNPELEQLYEAAGLFVDKNTRRSRLNTMWRQQAWGILFNDAELVPRLTWLIENPESASEIVVKRFSVLSELGRIESPSAMKAIAIQLCELKPRARDAITMIRRYRLGRSATGSHSQLTELLERTINTYLTAHTEVTMQDVQKALRVLLWASLDTQGEGEP